MWRSICNIEVGQDAHWGPHFARSLSLHGAGPESCVGIDGGSAGPAQQRGGADRGEARGAARRRAAGARREADCPGSPPPLIALNSRYRRHNNCKAATATAAYRFGRQRTFRESKKLTRSNIMRSVR